MVYESNGIRVELESIGEGVNGDFDPNDPDDIELLRFFIYRHDGIDWVPVDDATYCTVLPVAASTPMKIMAVEFIYKAIAEDVRAGLSIKRKCEELSWMLDVPVS